MQTISRRSALLGGAAALTAAATTAPVALKVAETKAALTAEPDPAFEAFRMWEAARADYWAFSERYERAEAEAEALYGPTPHDGIHWTERTEEQEASHRAINGKKLDHIEAALGGHPDDMADPYHDATWQALQAVLQSEPATLEGLRCKVYALLCDEMGLTRKALPVADDLYEESGFGSCVMLAYLHEDLEALAGGLRL